MTGQPTIELRRFLYLNDDLASELVAQLEEGAFDDYRYQQSGQSSAQGGARVGVPAVSISGEAERTSGEAVTFTRTLTPASRFAKLVRLLRAGGGLHESTADFESLQLGTMLLGTVDVKLSGVTSLKYGFLDLQRSERVFRSERRTAPAERFVTVVRKLARTDYRTQWDGKVRQMAQLERGAVAVVLHFSEGDFRILCRLEREHMQADPLDLVGPARALVKVRRLLDPGEVVDTANPFPIAQPLSEGFREGLSAGFADDPQLAALLGPLELAHPGGLGTAVAIYQ